MRTFLLCALLLGGPGSGAPVLRIEQGSVRLSEGASVRTLDRLQPSGALQSARAEVEGGANTTVGLSWRGQADLRISGPTLFHVRRDPVVALLRFQVAELEVRRGALTVSIAGLGELELQRAVLQVRALSDGAFEFTNRGGTEVEFRHAAGDRISIPGGKRLRVRP